MSAVDAAIGVEDTLSTVVVTVGAAVTFLVT